MFMTEELSNSSSTAFSNVYPSCKCIKPEDGCNIISDRMLQKYLFWELTSPCVAIYYYYWGMNVFTMHVNTKS